MTVKSTPVCSIAVLYVFPSMPTQAEAEYSPSVESTPEGAEGVGTVNFPDTALKVCPVGGEVMAIPDQFSLYSIDEKELLEAEEASVLVLESLALLLESLMVRARRCSRRARPAFLWGAAMAVEAKSKVLRRDIENFMVK